MINSDRIVPVMATDLITLYGLIMKQTVATLAKVDAATTDGKFAITSASTPLIASEPVKVCDFADSVSTATLYFVAALDFIGFTIDGTAVAPTGTITADGSTLYKAELSGGAITVSKVGF